MKLQKTRQGQHGSVSQPARAVWIEIRLSFYRLNRVFRHSLRGLCGLKCVKDQNEILGLLSQPARAVWIEILHIQLSNYLLAVTACEGCVD